jgi:hypothetical protein
MSHVECHMSICFLSYPLYFCVPFPSGFLLSSSLLTICNMRALVQAALHEGMKAMEWTAWLVGPSSTLTKPGDSSTPLPLRTVLLEHLACCVEASDPQVVLRAAALILHVAHTSQARLSTCKVLYTLSKVCSGCLSFCASKLHACITQHRKRGKGTRDRQTNKQTNNEQ